MQADSNSIIVDNKGQQHHHLREYTARSTITMTDTLAQKPKLQLRSGLSFNEKTPSPSAKLMINHGKPNFTIQRAPKSPQLNVNGNNGSSLSPAPRSGNRSPIQIGDTLTIINNNNNNEVTFKNANVNGKSGEEVSAKTQKFNGVTNTTNVPLTIEQENEVAKVVLRHVKRGALMKEATDESDSVPEFIRRQRRIQERLAKEGLDFENRRSGYFTQVMISPTTPNQRTSFVETMSSPAIVPALEIPPPVPSSIAPLTPGYSVEVGETELNTVGTEVLASFEINDHAQEEQDDVANAIEEVNKALADEDDEDLQEESLATVTSETVSKSMNDVIAVAEIAVGEIVQAAVDQVQETIENGQGHETTVTAATVEADVTILHTNGNVSVENGQKPYGPSIPIPDPSGALGVNFEPKTVVSFSKDLGSEPNKYPDTVKVNEELAKTLIVDGELAEMAKLKFDIKADEENVQVTPMLRAE